MTQGLSLCTSEMFDEMLDSPKTEDLRQQLANLKREWEAGCIDQQTYEDECKKLKVKLPCICPNAWFKQGHRCLEEAMPSGLLFVDLDHLRFDIRCWYLSQLSGREAEQGIVFAALSIRGDGLHIIKHRNPTLTREADAEAFVTLLGVKEYWDTGCCDLSRAMFASARSQVLYYDEEEMFADLAYHEEHDSTNMAKTDKGDEPEATKDTGDNCRVAPLTYMDIPYSEIVKELVSVMGGEPEVGNRNTFIHRLVSCLRGICDNDANLLQRITPSFGLSEKEVASIIKSATKEPVKGLWKEMKRVLAAFGTTEKEWWRVDDDLIEAYEQDVLHNLPSGLREIIKKVPENKQMNVLCSLLPVLATYAENISFHHATGEDGHMILMSAIIGDFGKGKSLLCKQACDLYLAPINEQDKPGWEANDEYYETQQTRSANENAGKKPHPVIRNIASVATTPYILERLKHSKGHSLVCVTAEVQDMNSNPTDNKDRSKLLRKSFDEEEHAVGRVGKESITGKVKVRLNTTVMGTFNAVQTFFGDGNIENGLASRFIISFLPHEVAQQWLNYKGYDEKTRHAAHQLTEMLTNRTGEVRTPRLDKEIYQWWDSKNKLVEKHNDPVLGSLINRMAVIGHRCGTLFHVMTGKKKETQTSVKFALLMAEYTLREQLRFFGSTLKQLAEQQTAFNNSSKSQNDRLLASLPDTFSFEDAKALKPDVKEGSVRRMLQRWVAKKLTEQLDNGLYVKK